MQPPTAWVADCPVWFLRWYWLPTGVGDLWQGGERLHVAISIPATRSPLNRARTVLDTASEEARTRMPWTR